MISKMSAIDNAAEFHPLKPPMAPPTILIVDDNPDNVMLLEAMLHSRGYATAAAGSGAGALAQVAAAPPALVLLDVMMPGLDGYEVARRIKSDPTLPFIPIILITAKQDMRDKVYALEQGADDFLSKPVHRAELLARVQALLRLKQAHDDLQSRHADLRALNERLQTSEREHEELVQMITHDLRSPLTALQGALELMNDGSLGPITERQRQFVRIGLQNSKTIGRMISDMLDVYRMEAGHIELALEPRDLARIAKEVSEQMEAAVLERGLALINSVPAGLPRVRADRDRLQHVLLNLITNAIKYTVRGQITLSAAAGGPLPDGMTMPDPYIIVAVTDTGPGIPDAARAQIFEKFYRVPQGSHDPRPRPIGTGLGLAFCKQTIRAHGGEIWVEPGEAGQGSRFAFTLPVADPPD
jgi:signal transduction histidine kinase